MKKTLKLIFLFTPLFLLCSGCSMSEPDSSSDSDISDIIIGTWRMSHTSSVGLTAYYQFTFVKDGTGIYTHNRAYADHYASYTWSCEGDRVVCQGMIVNVDSEGETDTSVWSEILTYNSSDGKLYAEKLKSVGGLTKEE